MAKRKTRNSYGKAWTVEWNTPKACWITDARSAATVEVRADGWISNHSLWANVPPYLRAIVLRRLRNYRRITGDYKRHNVS